MQVGLEWGIDWRGGSLGVVESAGEGSLSARSFHLWSWVLAFWLIIVSVCRTFSHRNCCSFRPPLVRLPRGCQVFNAPEPMQAKPPAVHAFPEKTDSPPSFHSQ